MNSEAALKFPSRVLLIPVTSTITVARRRPITNAAEGGIRRTTTATSAEIRGGSKRIANNSSNSIRAFAHRSSSINRGDCGRTREAKPNPARRGGRITAAAAGERGKQCADVEPIHIFDAEALYIQWRRMTCQEKGWNRGREAQDGMVLQASDF